MDNLARNQLVWLKPAAWVQIESGDWDSEALEILAHWHLHDLPLVVCRQRPGTHPEQTCLGLPAPQKWSRRRLALTVREDQLLARAELPTLAQVAQFNQWGAAALDLAEAHATVGACVYAYGSHGWQWLTGLAYVHAASDLDLHVAVHSFDVASQAIELLASTPFHCRIDGEIVFPHGQAIAWRELYHLVQGKTSQVLVKDRYAVRLAGLPEVHQLGHAPPTARPGVVIGTHGVALCP